MGALNSTPAIHKTRPITSNDVGTVPAGLAIQVEELGGPGHTRITRFTFGTDFSMAITDATTNGAHGGVKFYDFPVGNILITGYNVDLDITAGSGGITDTAAVVAGIGTATVANTNATLTGTEADVVPQTAATLTGGVGAFAATSASPYTALTDNSGGATADSTMASIATSPSNAAQQVIADNIAKLNNRINALADRMNMRMRLIGSATTAPDLFLNFAIPDAGSTANDTLAVSGTVEIHWVNLGANA